MHPPVWHLFQLLSLHITCYNYAGSNSPLPGVVVHPDPFSSLSELTQLTELCLQHHAFWPANILTLVQPLTSLRSLVLHDYSSNPSTPLPASSAASLSALSSLEEVTLPCFDRISSALPYLCQLHSLRRLSLCDSLTAEEEQRVRENMPRLEMLVTTTDLQSQGW